VWHTDRSTLRGWRALGNRVARIAVASAVGVVRHHLSSRAAALTYYTVFSVVPVLVVVLWILKGLHVLPLLEQELPVGFGSGPLAGNGPLTAALRGVLAAVERAGKFTGGIVGLVALLYGVWRLLANVNHTIDAIAAVRSRRPVYLRLLGYLVVLAVAPLMMVLGSVIGTLASDWLREALGRVVGTLPGSGLWLATFAVVASAWLGLTFLYGASARARIPLASAAWGAALAALALPLVGWAFAWFQIGVSRAATSASGFAAIPVFLLWLYSSWMAVLLGAEIAVAHSLDRTLIHGLAGQRLGPNAEIGVGVVAAALMARASLSGTGGLSVDALARELRVLPGTVAGICRRLVRAGMIARLGAYRYKVTCDLDTTQLSDVAEALAHEPDDGAVAQALVERMAPAQRPLIRSWFHLCHDAPASDLTLREAALALTRPRPTPPPGQNGRAAMPN